jgi:hypothetical protein
VNQSGGPRPSATGTANDHGGTATLSQPASRSQHGTRATHHNAPRPRCRIKPYLDQGGACGAAGPAPAPGSAVARPARRTPGHTPPAPTPISTAQPPERLVESALDAIDGRGMAVYLVLVRMPHPLWIVPAGVGPVNPS